MSLDDAKGYWWSERDADVVRLSPEEILLYVKSEARRFDKRIRFRDLREVIAAIVGLVLIVPAAVHGTLLTRLGVVALIVAYALVVVRLYRARRIPSAARMELPVAVALEHERSRVAAQIRLLESVFVWYLAPISLGVIMIIAGRAGASWLTFGCAAAVALLSLVLYRMNVNAARRHLQPRLEELSRLLGEVSAAGEPRA